MFDWLRARRRQRILAAPFPAAWDDDVDRNVRMARRLDPDARQALRDFIQVFIAERHWEGCGGLTLTEEIQVTIAAQAGILVLGRDDRMYADVASILVYPSTMITPPRRLGVFEQPRAPVSHGTLLRGEAMLGGPVVLAWDAVRAGGREEVPGNVVLHEFAHKLDMATGRIDGAPPLASRHERRRWAQVCAAAFARHRAETDAGWPTAIDPYGATNEAEFFAVATETFFTRPAALDQEHPALFALLRDFYRIDPHALAPPPPVIAIDAWLPN